MTDRPSDDRRAAGRPMHPAVDRRTVLRSGGAGLAAAVAGCTTGDGSTDTDTDTATDERLRLESVAVGGSPGGPIPLRPPGKVVLLDFFATWCAPCKPEMANLRAARSRFDREQVFIVSITQETDEQAITEFWRRHDGTWPVVVDADLEATREYDVSRIPTIVVLTPDGEPVTRHTGLMGESRIVDAIERARQNGGER